MYVLVNIVGIFCMNFYVRISVLIIISVCSEFVLFPSLFLVCAMFLLPWTDLLTTLCATRTGTICAGYKIQYETNKLSTSIVPRLLPNRLTLSYMMKTGEEPSWWSCSNWGGV